MVISTIMPLPRYISSIRGLVIFNRGDALPFPAKKESANRGQIKKEGNQGKRGEYRYE